MSEAVLKALAVTAELSETTLSKMALTLMLDDLSGYTEGDVLKALSRFRKECSCRLTAKAIVDLINDEAGYVSGNEAWAIVVAGRDEAATVVSNDLIGEAWTIASPVIQSGDDNGARMAFRDAYERIVKKAIEQGRRPKWFASLGSDAFRHEPALSLAVRQGRLASRHVAALLPPPIDERGEAIAGLLSGQIRETKDPEFSARIRGLLDALRGARPA